MRKINLAHGKYAIVDDEWYGHLSQLKWIAVLDRKRGGWYARTNRNGETIDMDSWIAAAPKGRLVNHKNGNSLDNRRVNLRLAPQSRKERNFRKQKRH